MYLRLDTASRKSAPCHYSPRVALQHITWLPPLARGQTFPPKPAPPGALARIGRFQVNPGHGYRHIAGPETGSMAVCSFTRALASIRTSPPLQPRSPPPPLPVHEARRARGQTYQTTRPQALETRHLRSCDLPLSQLAYPHFARTIIRFTALQLTQ